MLRNNWKKYTLLLISTAVLLCAEKLVQACADEGDPYDYYPSFFSNKVVNENAYMPFYYTGMTLYYDEWYEPDTSYPIPDANISEWKAFTGNAASVADLDSFIYRYPYNDLSNLYYNLEKSKPLQIPAAMQQNSFTRWFQNGKDLEALGYLMYAKQCEPYAVENYEWNAPERDTAKMGRLERNGMKLYAVAKNDFFRWRYAWQVLRMSFYRNDDPKHTLALYEQTVGDKTADNLMYPRCLAIKAGALYRMGRKTEAAYLYSLVFDRSDDQKRKVYISYDWSADSSYADVLKYCKNNHEKAVVYVMEGLHEYYNGLPLLEKAYAADPNVKGMDVIMTREINKLEERYLQRRLVKERNMKADWNSYGWGDYVPEGTDIDSLDRSYGTLAEKLSAFAQKLAKEGKNKRPAFWWLSAAYLAYMHDDIAGCNSFLSKAEKAGMNDREHDLHDIIHILYTVKSSRELTPKTEAKLLPELQWLDGRAAKNKAFEKPYRDLVTTVLVTPYLKQKDTVRAIYVLARTYRNKYGGFDVSNDFLDQPGSLLTALNSAKLQEVKAFYQKKNKTGYEQWLTQGSAYDMSTLYELEGTMYLREYQFEKAAGVLKNVDAAELDYITLTDAFIPRIKDQLEYEERDSAKMYNKLSFAQKMAALKQKATADPKDAQSAFDYATGLYSMSYYGKDHNFYTYYRGTTDGNAYYETNERKAMPDYAREFYGVYTAEKYFMQAFNNTGDAEMKAKCLWMAAKCWQKRCPSGERKEPSYYPSQDELDDYYRYSLTSPYYKQLKEGFRNTRYFDKVQSSCSYLRDYLKKK